MQIKDNAIHVVVNIVKKKKYWITICKARCFFIFWQPLHFVFILYVLGVCDLWTKLSAYCRCNSFIVVSDQ